MVYKVKDDKDGRSVRICLTPEGEEKRNLAADVVKNFNKRLRKKVSNKEFEIFLKVMNTVNEMVDSENEIDKELIEKHRKLKNQKDLVTE